MVQSSHLRQSRIHALLALALLVPAPSLGVFFAMMYEPTRGSSVGQMIYSASKVWILVLPLIWLTRVDRARISLSPPRYGGLFAGLASGVLIAAAIFAAYLVFGRELIDAKQMQDAARDNGIDSPLIYLGLAAYLTFVNALLEEYVWRWFVFRKCEVVLGSGPAVITSAALFTLHHVLALQSQTTWSVTALASAGIFVGGCTWSWLYQRYRSIWPGYVSHVLADVASLTIGWLVIFQR